MDILTHALSGAAVGTVMASFSTSGTKDKLLIILFTGFAATLPDFDAISLWSRFDSTIGAFFNLTHSGKVIYSEKFWYSHHAFLHSAVAGVLFAALLESVYYLIKTKFRELNPAKLLHTNKTKKLLLIAFFLGFLMHLIEDMPTPASTWGGVNLFWPSKAYIGGTGDIWWWNNYDIFLIVVAVLFVNTLLLILQKHIRIGIRKIVVGVFLIGFILAFIQIKTRGYNFAYSDYTNSYQEYETKSKEIQKEILGDRLYNLMESFDKKLRIYF